MDHLSPSPSRAKAEPPKRGRLIILDRNTRLIDSAAWDRLTARLVMQQHERGELPSAILEAMLAGIGLHP